MLKIDLPAPQEPKGLAGWCVRHFQRVAAMWGADVDSVTLVVLHAAPAQTRPGMLVIADGTDWDPGSGAGLYRRNEANAAWVFIG
jgi:hypothetical protein